jgi:purine nucleosidase
MGPTIGAELEMAVSDPSSPATPVVMDVDTGIDDAIALLLAVRSPELHLVGVGTVAGNVDAELAARNTLRVLEVAGAAEPPVAIGAATPLLEPWSDVGWIHGDDGLGNSAQPAPSRVPSEEHAVEQLIRLSHEHAGALTVVAIGPLTNLALALRRDAGLPSRLRRVVIMGGSVRAGGNRGPQAEANVAVDPEAAAIVFEADLERTMIGLDVTMQVRLDDDDVASFARSGDPVGELAAQLLPHYLDVYERTSGERRCAQHDPLAVAVAARPDLVTTRSVPLRIETSGRYTRGMTVADLRPPRSDRPDHEPHTDVALEVRTVAFLDLLRERLTNHGRPS